MARKSPFARGERRVYAQRYVLAGVRAGVGVVDLLERLRVNGLGYRTENFLEDYHRYAAMPRLPLGSSLARLPKDVSLTYTPRVIAHLKRNWLYSFRVAGKIADTGEEVVQPFSITSDERLSDEQISSRFLEKFESLYAAIEYDHEDVEFTGSYKFYTEI